MILKLINYMELLSRIKKINKWSKAVVYIYTYKKNDSFIISWKIYVILINSY